MSLAIAQLNAALVGRYAVERVLGEGGMATVYLAHDVRHARLVAVKVLRPELATAVGAERFLEEIRTTAGLQHPHIVPLHDSGEALGTVYYVMPFVEGESLRDRLTREGPLPVADAVRTATEVASALAHAHRRGIAHRDIKPENILLQDGRALVADFGVALAVGRTADARLTASGLSVGTPQYMSPEQAMGERTITPRADIFALGVVLYEMLAGEPPFTGPTAQLVVARTISQEPTPVRELRQTVPEHVAAAITTALAKLPGDRFADAESFAAALAGRAADPAASPAVRTAASADARRARVSSRAAAVAVALTAVGASILTWGLAGRGSAAPPLVRAAVTLDRGERLAFGFAPLDLSRDGRYLAYVAETDGQSVLVVRALADSGGRRLPGTEGARDPFFSRDGEWLGYFAGERLMRVPSAGGAPSVVAELSGAANGGTWGDATIAFAAGGRLFRIRGERGATEEIVIREARMFDGTAIPVPRVRGPELLPGDGAALVTSDSGVAIVDLVRGTLRVILRGSSAQFVPPGHLAYDDGEGRIRLVAFDARGGTSRGESRPLLEAFRTAGGGMSMFAVSDAGVVGWVAGSFRRRLVRVAPDGRETVVTAEPRGYRFPRFSPDGRTIAVTVDPRPSSIWLVDAARGSASRLTLEDRHSITATWSPDGARVAFSAVGLDWVPAAGGPAVPFLRWERGTRAIGAASWLRDGRILGVEGRDATWQGTRQLVVLSPGDTTLAVLTAEEAHEDMPALSPDERWLAYTSDISGRSEVYVRRFAGGGATALISTGGGTDPRWSSGSDRVYYRHGTRVLSVRLRIADGVVAAIGEPTTVADGDYDFSQTNNWDVARDGSLVLVRSDPPIGSQVRLLLNWDPAATMRALPR